MADATQPRPPRHGYSRVTRALHWLTAAAILAAVVLGLVMTRLPAESEAQVAQVFRAYSVHKTIGLLALVLGTGLILRSLARPGPGPLHPERRTETFLARLTHWTLWIALLALPVSGLLHHSAAPGFAPILWPLGQRLPFVPADEGLALTFRSVHAAAGWFLIAALALHVAGALKHALIDRDATLGRMVTGKGPPVPAARPARASAAAALVLWAGVLLVGIALAPEPEPDPFGAFDDTDFLNEMEELEQFAPAE